MNGTKELFMEDMMKLDIASGETTQIYKWNKKTVHGG